MNIALWICQVVLAVMFGFAGFIKVFQYAQAKEKLPWVKDFSKGFVSFVGASEILGALGLILPSLTGILAWLTPLAALGLAIVMVLAAILHVKRGENQEISINLILLLLSLFVAYGRFVMLPL